MSGRTTRRSCIDTNVGPWMAAVARQQAHEANHRGILPAAAARRRAARQVDCSRSGHPPPRSPVRTPPGCQVPPHRACVSTVPDPAKAATALAPSRSPPGRPSSKVARARGLQTLPQRRRSVDVVTAQADRPPAGLLGSRNGEVFLRQLGCGIGVVGLQGRILPHQPPGDRCPVHRAGRFEASPVRAFDSPWPCRHTSP